MTDLFPSFARLLERYRLAAGLTQRQLAARSGLSARGISNLERGIRRFPYRHTVEALAAALQLAPETRERFFAAAHNERRLGRRPPLPGLPPLTGRAAELDAVERHLARGTAPAASKEPAPTGEGPAPAAGGPGLLLLAGEPGIGKTRLLQEAAAHAMRRGLTVLAGGCDRHGSEEPYAPFPSMLAGLLDASSTEKRADLLHDCDWLIRLLPDLAAPDRASPSLGLPAAQERRLVFSAVRRLLGRVAGSEPLVLLLDDLQWAGAGALDLLEFLLAPSVGGAHIRAIGAYRDTEIGEPLRAALAGLAERQFAGQIDLAPLDLEASAALLDTLLLDRGQTGSLKQRIIERAGGVPFFLISCAQNAEAGEEQAPWNVAQSVRRRVDALSPLTQHALEAAAIAGREVERDILLAAIDVPADSALAALDEACAARLLAVQRGIRYHFSHDLIREVIEGDLSAGRRTSLHRRYAHLLEERVRSDGRGAAQIARHFRGAGDAGPALVWCMRAGDEAAAALAHDLAEEQYRLAAELAAELDDATTEAVALERRGQTRMLSGQYDGALPVLEQAAEGYRALRDLDGEGRVMALIGMTYRERGFPAEGIARLEPMIARMAESGTSLTLARLQVTLAHALFVAGRYGESAEAAGTAGAMAREVGDERTVAEAGARLGACLTNLRRNDEAVPVLEEAAARAERSGDVQVCAIAVTNLGIAYAVAGRNRDRLRALRHALELIEQLGDPNWAALALTNLAEALMDIGEWRQARDVLERARTQTPPDAAWTAASPLTVLIKLALAQGRWTEARVLLDEGRRVAGASSDPMLIYGVERGLAGIELMEGNPEAAIRRLEPLLDGRAEADISAAYGLTLLAWAYLQGGRIDDAGHVADTAVRLLHRAPGSRPGALRAQAAVAVARGDWEAAERGLAEMLRLAREAGSPGDEALALLDIGLLCLRRGNSPAGRDLITRALETLRRLEIAPAVRQAEEALASAGA